MKKYITAIFPLILCAIPSYAAQWSCPSCTKAELQALFEKHVASDRLEGVLQVFNSNLSDNGVLKSDGIAKTCIATWGRGGLGTLQYKNCEKLAIDLINLAKNKNAKTYNKNVVAWRDIPNIVGLELEKPAAKCSKKSTNLIYKGNRAWEFVCDGITHNFKFAEVTCESGETFNEQKGECEQSNTKLAKSPASKKPAGTPDTEYKPDGVEILSSGYVVPVNEFPHRGEAVNRAKQVLKQQTGVDYKCGAPRQHETEVLCQHPTNTSVYVKVKFAGFTDSESTSTPKESPAAAATSTPANKSNNPVVDHKTGVTIDSNGNASLPNGNKIGNIYETSPICSAVLAQRECERYNNALRSAPAQRGTVYSLALGSYGECLEQYGYEFNLYGCRKKK